MLKIKSLISFSSLRTRACFLLGGIFYSASVWLIHYRPKIYLQRWEVFDCEVRQFAASKFVSFCKLNFIVANHDSMT